MSKIVDHCEWYRVESELRTNELQVRVSDAESSSDQVLIATAILQRFDLTRLRAPRRLGLLPVTRTIQPLKNHRQQGSRLFSSQLGCNFNDSASHWTLAGVFTVVHSVSSLRGRHTASSSTPNIVAKSTMSDCRMTLQNSPLWRVFASLGRAAPHGTPRNTVVRSFTSRFNRTKQYLR